MKHLYYILFVLLFFLSTSAGAQENSRKNELLQELAKSPNDTTRLNILFDLSVVSKSQPLVRIYYLNQLLEEAEKQNNDLYKCKAYLHRMYLAYNALDVPTLHYWFSLLEPLAQKNKFHDLKFQGKRCVIDFLQLSGEYEKEESESLLLLEEAEKVGSVIGMISANQALGNSYIMTNRNEEALAAFEKAYSLASNANNPALVLEIIHSLIEVAERGKDYPRWYKYLEQEEECINKSIRESNVNYSLQSSLFMMYIHHVAYYTIMKDMDLATHYYQLADSAYYASAETGLFQEYYLRVGSVYLQLSGQYEKALAQVDTLAMLFRPVSALGYNEALQRRANILHLMGRDVEALELFKETKIERDSLQIELLNTQTEQVKSIHEVYLLEMEKERNNRYLQIIILSFLIVSIITIAIFTIYIYRARKKLEWDESEMRKMTREVELANSAKERFLSNISTSIKQPLSRVVNNSLLLASGASVEDERRIAISEVINKTSFELMQLINDILDLSRLEAGMMRFVLSDVEVFSLIHDAATGISGESGKLVNITCPQSALFWSHIDGARLLSVFNNLFSLTDSEDELQVEIEVNDGGTELMIKVYGTSLAQRNLSQNMIIRNEINRMIIHHFEGVYENRVKVQPLYVYFTIKGRFTSLDQN